MAECDVVICGGAVRPFGRSRDESSPRDWVRGVVDEALRDAGIERHDIDSVIVASESDHLSLQLSPAALMTDEAGMNPCPAMRIECGGASGAAAIRTGVMHIMSGMHRCVLVVGFEHAASHLASDDVRRLYGLSFDADVEGMTGVTATNLYALSIGLFMARYGLTEAQMARVSVKNHGNAMTNPWAHLPRRITVADVLASRPVSAPYRLLDCSPLSDGAAAVIMMRAGAAPSRDAGYPAILGTGCASDRVRLGDRSRPEWFSSKTLAGKAALAMAGIFRRRSMLRRSMTPIPERSCRRSRPTDWRNPSRSGAGVSTSTTGWRSIFPAGFSAREQHPVQQE
jgi:acetyl-CoA C-acetyltransferase